jgi:23S rRNA (uracil1939-C5)-methyltransferase
MGYYRRRSRQIVDIRECLIAGPALLALRESIKPFLRFLLAEGKVLDVFVQIVGDTVDVVLTGPVGRSGEPDRGVQEALVGLLETTSVTRIGWRPTVRDEIEPLVWNGPVVAKFGPLQVELPPAAFLQPTLEGEQALVSGVMAALPPQGTFADLFSGCGTFSGPMLAGGAVEAFEVVRPAVSALQKAARGHALKVFRRDLFARPLQRRELDRYDAVVLDPPRAGCPEQASALASSKVPKIVSVSCNPATFARDARLICEGGYRLVNAQVFDQFLWSHHVELIGVFAKVKAWKRR